MARARKPKPGDDAWQTCAAPGCPMPGHQITNAQAARAVRTLTGPMHLECWQRMQSEIDESRRAAIVAGTHSNDHKRVCSGCGEWRELYAKSAQTRDEWCFACAMKSGEFDKLTEPQLTAIGEGQVPNPIPQDPEFPARCRAERARRVERRERIRRFSTQTGV